MFYNDHPPPHFHVRYGRQRAIVDIAALSVLEGSLSPRVVGLWSSGRPSIGTNSRVNWEQARAQTLRHRRERPLTAIVPTRDSRVEGETAMAAMTLKVALTEALEAYVTERVAEGGYGSPGDYICALIRADQERRARATLDRLLLEGVDSEPDLVTPEYLIDLRREAKERIERRRKRA